jgi:chemotaxis protein histidine kinase CheA
VEVPSTNQVPPSTALSERYQRDEDDLWRKKYNRLFWDYQALKGKVQAVGASQVNTQIDKLEKELEDIYRAKIDKLEKELDTWAELVDDLHERLDRHHKLIDHFLG